MPDGRLTTADAHFLKNFVGILPSATVITSVILSTFYIPLGKQRPPPPSRHPSRQTPHRADTTPPPPTVTGADGTHPIGMHSCFGFFFCLPQTLNVNSRNVS